MSNTTECDLRLALSQLRRTIRSYTAYKAADQETG
jgi:hypothetical protein